MENNKKLLEIYSLGFNDELYNKPVKTYSNLLQDRAYIIGRMDAIAGDDVSSVDEQSDDDILKHIKNI